MFSIVHNVLVGSNAEDKGMNCRFCGKSFNHGFNLRGHESESEHCSLQGHKSSIESDFDQSDGMSTKRKYSTNDFTSERDFDNLDNRPRDGR